MKKTTLLILTSLLSGCSLFDVPEVLPLYTLRYTSFEPREVLSTSLAVDTPLSEASLNTTRIAITPSAFQRDYLADGQWPDRLPKVLQEVFLESFGERWGEVYVNRMGSALDTQYLLQSEIQDFSVYNLDQEQPEVRVKILFKLIELRSRKVIAAQTFAKITPASSATMRSIVEAFNQDVHELLKDTICWMEEVFLKEKP